MRLAQLRFFCDIEARGFRRAGLELHLSCPPTQNQLFSLQLRVRRYLRQTARARYGERYFSQKQRVPRLFFAAVLATDDINDHGMVEFFFTPAELAGRVRDRFSRVSVEVIDADQPLEALLPFLRPYHLAAAHYWSHELRQSMDTTLIERWQHVHKLNREAACARLRAYLLWEGAGVRTVDRVWSK